MAYTFASAPQSTGFVVMKQMKGKWAFEGKDDKRVVWSGTLTVKELDTTSFDANRLHSIFSLEARSQNGSNGVEAPCRFMPVGIR